MSGSRHWFTSAAAATALSVLASGAWAQAPAPQAPQQPPPSPPAAPQQTAPEQAEGEDGGADAGEGAGEAEAPPAAGEGATPIEGEQAGDLGQATPPGQAPPTPGEEGAPPAEGEAGEQPLRLLVVDAATYGIDPVVGRHVTERMRETGAELGYEVLDRDATVAAAQQVRMPYPPTPADLWRVTYAGQAQRGAFARVWAHAGSYVIEIVVASLDGAGPFFARGTAGAADLHEVVARLVRQALPAPEQWEGVMAAGERPPAPQAEPPPPEPASRPEPPEEDRTPPIRHRWNLVLQTEGAIGTSQDSFYNHLFGARVDYRISREILVGAYFGYANLRGKDGRVSNMLTYLQIEDRVRISSGSDITVPLRLGIGYLPFNGPVVRLAAGVNFPLTRRIELGFDLLTPTFWVLPDRTAVSLDIAAELVWRL